MIYTQHGERVTLEMTRNDFQKLIFIIGAAIGRAGEIGGDATFYSWLRFANELNNGNPSYAPYIIPEEYDK